MSIVCIKVGENEPETYKKFDKLSKHMDIIDVLPRKRDKDGNLLNRTAGTMGDKLYYCINVDMDELDDKEFHKMRMFLTMGEEQETGGFDYRGRPDKETIRKRIWSFDLANKRSHLGMPQNVYNKIELRGNLRRQKKDYDMRDINDFITKVPFDTFARVATSKQDGKTLYERLGLSTKTLRQAAGEITF